MAKAKRKWHVVTVGRDVGVFETWLEAGRHVNGCPEAIYQSFATEEEARAKFEEEYCKGNTRIVLDSAPRSQRRAERRAPTAFEAEPVFTASPRSRFERASTVYQSANEHSYTPNNTSSPSQRLVSPPQYATSPVSRTRSDPSGDEHRHQFVVALFEQHQGHRVHGQGTPNSRNGHGRAAGTDDVGARATTSPVGNRSIQVAPASRPSTTTRSESVRSASPSTGSVGQPMIVVKTPEWLGQYPKGSPSLASSGLLSPLPVTNFPLNRAMARSHTVPSTPRGRRAPYMMGSPSTHQYQHSPHHPGPSTSQGSVTDPRSPINSHARIPELTYVQPLSFSRPSPSNRTRELFSQTIHDTPPKSSLLLRPQV